MRSKQICPLHVVSIRRGTSLKCALFPSQVLSYPCLIMVPDSVLVSYKLNGMYLQSAVQTWNVVFLRINKYSWNENTCVYCTLKISIKPLPPSPLGIASLPKQNTYDASGIMSLLCIQIFGHFPILSLPVTFLFSKRMSANETLFMSHVRFLLLCFTFNIGPCLLLNILWNNNINVSCSSFDK